MGLKVTGAEQLEQKITELNYGVQKNARKALKAGTDIFVNQLKSNTPIWKQEQHDPFHMVDDIKNTGVKQNGGDLTVQIGYGHNTGYRVHFPNNGTSRQSPQHFVEMTQAQTQDQILQEFLRWLKI